MQPPEHVEPAEARQEEVQHDEIPGLPQREREPNASVAGALHRVTLGLETPREEREDPRLVLDDKYPHRRQIRP